MRSCGVYLQINLGFFSRNMCTSGSLKAPGYQRKGNALDWKMSGTQCSSLPFWWKAIKNYLSLAHEVLWFTVKVDLFTDSDHLLHSGGGKEYQRKFSSILFISFVILIWMSLGTCSVLLDYAVKILFWLPKGEQCVTHHHSVCVYVCVCNLFLLLCCVQSARRVRS